MTFVVDVPPNRESERRYILDVVLGDWLGLSWRMRVQERRDVRISAGDGVNERCLTMPDVLFDACNPLMRLRNGRHRTRPGWRVGYSIAKLEVNGS